MKQTTLAFGQQTLPLTNGNGLNSKVRLENNNNKSLTSQEKEKVGQSKQANTNSEKTIHPFFAKRKVTSSSSNNNSPKRQKRQISTVS